MLGLLDVLRHQVFSFAVLEDGADVESLGHVLYFPTCVGEVSTEIDPGGVFENSGSNS